MRRCLWMLVSALLAATFGKQARGTSFTDRGELTRTMNEAVRRHKGESPKDFCERLGDLWSASKLYRKSDNRAFALARATLSHVGHQFRCAWREDGASNPLWEEFRKARDAVANEKDPSERTRIQGSLREAAMWVLRSLSPLDPRFQEVVDELAVSVVPKDKAMAVQAIVDTVSPQDLKGDQGMAVAKAVANLLQRIPPTLYEGEQFDPLIDFMASVANNNPEWLQHESGRNLLEAVLRGLQNLPADKIGEPQVQTLFGILAKIVARNPNWLRGEHSKALATFVPRLLEQFDVANAAREDLESLLALTAKVFAGRSDWPEQVRNLAKEWDQILQIVSETKTPATRAILLRAVHDLRRRYGEEYAALEREVTKTEPDPQAMVSLLKALGIAHVEELRRARAAMVGMEVANAVFLYLRALISLGLPQGCDEKHRDGAPSFCATAFTFVDAFREAVVHGAPEGADFGPSFRSGMQQALLDAQCTLLPGEPRPSACEPFVDLAGTFSSFVGIEIGLPKSGSPNAALTARAGCVVVSANRLVSRLDEVNTVSFSPEATAKDETVLAAQKLANEVVNRCTLSRPSNDFAAKLVSRIDPPSAASALLFAGLPYSRDGRVSPGLSGVMSAADFSTLVVGVGGVMAGIYAHNTSNGPWDDRFLRIGIVSLGLNVIVKVGAAIYYAEHYGTMSK